MNYWHNVAVIYDLLIQHADGDLPTPEALPWPHLAPRRDTDKTAFRSNHVADEKWMKLSVFQQIEWLKETAKIMQKSIVNA